MIDPLLDRTDADERLLAAGNRWKHTRDVLGLLVVVDVLFAVGTLFSGQLIPAGLLAANAVGLAYCWVKSRVPALELK